MFVNCDIEYIYRLSSIQCPDLKAVYSTNHLLTSRLSTWVVQSKDMLMVNFLFSHHHLFGHYHICSFFIIHFSSVVCQDLFIPCQIKCMCGQNRHRFILPSERLSIKIQIPCLKGLRNDQQKSCFLLSLPVIKGC